MNVFRLPSSYLVKIDVFCMNLAIRHNNTELISLAPNCAPRLHRPYSHYHYEIPMVSTV